MLHLESRIPSSLTSPHERLAFPVGPAHRDPPRAARGCAAGRDRDLAVLPVLEKTRQVIGGTPEVGKKAAARRTPSKRKKGQR